MNRQDPINYKLIQKELSRAHQLEYWTYLTPDIWQVLSVEA